MHNYIDAHRCAAAVELLTVIQWLYNRLKSALSEPFGLQCASRKFRIFIYKVYKVLQSIRMRENAMLIKRDPYSRAMCIGFVDAENCQRELAYTDLWMHDRAAEP